MSHCDGEQLALMALGETAGDAERQHVAECPRCQSRLDQLRAVVSTARSLTDDDRPVAPPPAVWEAIRLEVAAPVGDPAATAATDLGAARARRRPWLIAGIAAACGALLGGVVTAGAMSSTRQPDLVAEAALAPMQESGLSGSAYVESTDAGAVLHVAVPGLPPVADGYYEVWMATPDASTMVAIGTLNPGDETTLVLPAGMDMASFPVIDVSVEHFDGDPEHSAQSVVRGQLAT